MSERNYIGNILDDNEEDRQRRTLINMLKPMAENKLLSDKKSEFAKFRSTSAPPEMDSNLEPTTPVTHEDPYDQFRSDPAYYTFYHQRRLLNPRLPPPITTNWGHSTFEGEDSYYNNDEASAWDQNKPSSPLPQPIQKPVPLQNPTSLVARIQEDFPRTPSPVYNKRHSSDLDQITNSSQVFGGTGQYMQLPQAQPLRKPMPMLQPQPRGRGGNVSAPTPMFFPDTTSGTDHLVHQMQNLHVSQSRFQQPISIQPGVVSSPYNQYGDNGIYSGGYYNYQPQVNPTAIQRKPFQQVPSSIISPHSPYDEFYQPQQMSPPNNWENQPKPTEQRTNGRSKRNKQEETASPVARSKLMEEFKSGRGRKFELKDIVGHVVEFSRDQHGSRFIQQKLETANKQEKEVIFEEIYPEALELMTDVFGNYVIQKFFEHGLPHQKRQLAQALKGHVLSLTLQTYGCRVIQKAMEVIEDSDKQIICDELDGHVMRCVQDQNGNHVIQKCIEKVPYKMVQFIVDSFIGNVTSQAVHAYGCRVIQRILEHCDEKQSSVILNEIMANAARLVRDQYGNYVVQHVLEHGQPKHKAAIIKTLKGNILTLSHNKFASNVIEKCYQFGNKKERQDLLDEIVGKNSGRDISQSPLFSMMKDQYANYVIQKIIELSDDQQRCWLFEVMKPHVAAIRRLTYGKHIIACIERYHKFPNI